MPPCPRICCDKSTLTRQTIRAMESPLHHAVSVIQGSYMGMRGGRRSLEGPVAVIRHLRAVQLLHGGLSAAL